MKKMILTAALLITTGLAYADDFNILTSKPIDSDLNPLQLDNGTKFTKAYGLLNAKKDEYETEEQYQSRMSKVDQAKYYFLGDLEQSNVSYDAERQMFIVNKMTNSNTNYSDYSSSLKFKLHTDMIEKGSYIGSNAYGAKAKITKADIVNRSLIVTIPYSRKSSLTYIVGNAIVDPITAKKIRDKLKFLYVGQAKFSEVTMSKSHFSPTMDLALDGDSTNYSIKFKLEGLYLYDSSTNKVLAPLYIQ